MVTVSEAASERFDATLEAYDEYCNGGSFEPILRDLANRSYPGKSAVAAAERDKFTQAGRKILTTPGLERDEENVETVKWPHEFHVDASNYHGPFRKTFKPTIMNFMTSSKPLEECVSTYADYKGTPHETVSYLYFQKNGFKICSMNGL
jgi:hypothetical protein